MRHGRLAYTNKLRFGAFRGFGVPQVTFAAETQIDEIADALGLDPIEFRLQECSSATAILVRRPADRLERPGRLPRTNVRSAFGLERRTRGTTAQRPRQPPRASASRCSAHISGLLATGAIVRLLEDGTVLLNTGAVDIGQGSNTVLTQICAEALQLPIERVSIASPDTDGSPYNWGTTASRVTYMTGTLGRRRGRRSRAQDQGARRRDARMRARRPGAPARRPVADQGRRRSARSASPPISGRAHWAAGGPIIGSHSWVFDQKTVRSRSAPPSSACRSRRSASSVFSAIVRRGRGRRDDRQVRRDRRAWSACDVGRAINPHNGRRPDRGRVRPGHGLRAVRGDGLERRAASPTRA